MFRLDPFALPVRHAAPIGGSEPAFILDRDRAVVRRALPHSGPVTLAVPVSAYAGVAVRIVPEGDEGAIRVHVELLHDDPGLTLPLLVAEEPEEAAADWQAWGRALNLPLLVVEQDGTIRAPLSRLGQLTVGTPGPRRLRRFLSGRRPRFLRRRKIGRSGPITVVSGREIIARN
ncbi:MAG TPA: DUF6101 family protein [Bauldia sp.]|nr:DUF6101 family protein [Bauldia sp.]